LPQDRPEEFQLYRLNPPTHAEADDFERRRFGDIVAFFAMVALVILGYWVFHALDHSRRFQQCLDSGRRNCVDFVNASK